jgi:hypothetical protein
LLYAHKQKTMAMQWRTRNTGSAGNTATTGMDCKALDGQAAAAAAVKSGEGGDGSRCSRSAVISSSRCFLVCRLMVLSVGKVCENVTE